MAKVNLEGEQMNRSNSFREKINKNFGLIFIIFICVIIGLFVTLQIKVNNLNIQTEKNIENINLRNEKIISKIEDFSN
ncbi:MAG: hypothetical protein MUP69_00940, partial [Candidatus Atribacteria bacterium]|nr:hypothetical protein [Candidatus Atribacteria bacterium]